MDAEDGEEDHKVDLSQGLVNVDVSELTSLAFVSRVLSE